MYERETILRLYVCVRDGRRNILAPKRLDAFPPMSFIAASNKPGIMRFSDFVMIAKLVSEVAESLNPCLADCKSQILQRHFYMC